MKSTPEVAGQNVSLIVKSNLCIGCGLCSVACSTSVIAMTWYSHRSWRPEIKDGNCTYCGVCLKVCPQSPQCIVEYAVAAKNKGVRFGLPEEGPYYIAYDQDETKRIRSASGGVASALLEYLLTSGAVDGVIGSLPLKGSVGEPHFQMTIFRSVEELGQGRSSHYHPLSYDKVLSEIGGEDGKFAIVGVPCVLRGIARLPAHLQKRIKYKVGLVCSHNVTGAFSDCLARKEGVRQDIPWQLDFRDKVGIPDANQFNNLVSLPDRQIRKNRFATAFTDMWRNYYFAQECCFFCSDFFGNDADISVKDAWGALSKDPLGISLLIVRNPDIDVRLRDLKKEGRLYLKACDADEVLNSQKATAVFKQVNVLDRLPWKTLVREELKKIAPDLSRRNVTSLASLEYVRLLMLMHLSNFFYFRLGKVPVKSLIWCSNPFHGVKLKWESTKNRIWKGFFFPLGRALALFLGIVPVRRAKDLKRPRVLIAGGYGYGNVGDEAQLAANIQYWKKIVPECRLTVLTPNRHYTESVHGPIRTDLAPRLCLFGKGERQYFGSIRKFKRMFFPVSILCLVNARLIRAGLPSLGLSTRQARLLEELYNSDVLFLSGGGYLTGMTWTRLWDNMLLIRLAHALGVPTIMSGQTIGVFKDRISQFLAKWGLKKAKWIYLRDHVGSIKELTEIGISLKKVKATFDDALFFEAASRNEVLELLSLFGIDIGNPYLVVNAHSWGQTVEASTIIIKNLAVALDSIYDELGLQIVFCPMVSTDEDYIAKVRQKMKRPSFVPEHRYFPALAVGFIQNAELCLTMKHHPIIFAMAAGIPTVSMAFDDYYFHKNFGAHQIFGQEEYVVNCRAQQLTSHVLDKVGKLYENRNSISREIMHRVEGKKKLAGEVIFKWTSGL